MDSDEPEFLSFNWSSPIRNTFGPCVSQVNMYRVGERLGINMFAAPLASDPEQILRRRTRRQERDERAARRASRGGVQKREILPRSQRPDPNEVIDLTASAFIDLTRDDTELTGSTNDECPAVRDASTVDFASTGNEDPSANKSKVASVEDEREYVTESSDAASTEVAAYRAYTRPEPGSSRRLSSHVTWEF